MGSRITISLSQVISGGASVTILPENEDSGALAEIRFPRRGEMASFSVFMGYEAYEGRVTLSMDWNWFRYEENHISRRFLRALYEFGIDFKVFH